MYFAVSVDVAYLIYRRYGTAPIILDLIYRTMKTQAFFRTRLGSLYVGRCEELIKDRAISRYLGKVQLIFTSPPFPLNRKKAYGNRTGKEYLEWIQSLAPSLRDFLTPDGSIVIEMGNAWEKGRPVQSTLPTETLLEFQKKGNLNLCQEFTYYNSARLPSPIQWVNVERIRVKDATTKIWWMAPSERPKASNRNVLKEYSHAQKELIRKRRYNAGKRPSEYNIGATSFAVDNGGAIPPNLIEIANTTSSGPYQTFCRDSGIPLHPARMPVALAEFFIKFLTDEGDIVFDPFGGSNTTGWAAEQLKRRWITMEFSKEYAAASIARFSKEKAEAAFRNHGGNGDQC